MPFEFLSLADRSLAYQYLRGNASKPALLFLGGYAADMTGTKATFLAERCATADLSYIRFDYRGNGASVGDFRAFTLGDWMADTLAIFDALVARPHIVIGSSMGAWLALKAAVLRPERFRALIGVAAAPDFTEDLVLPQLTPAMKAQLDQRGEIRDGHAVMTKNFLEEARDHLVLRTPLRINCPVRLLQGMEDREIPWSHALRIAENVGHDVHVTLIKDGDHRLSRAQDLSLLWQTVQSFF